MCTPSAKAGSSLLPDKADLQDGAFLPINLGQSYQISVKVEESH